MCMGGGKPKIPTPPPPPAPVQLPDEGVGKEAGNEQRKRAAAAAGASSTIMTGPQGLITPASTTRKSLLGG